MQSLSSYNLSEDIKKSIQDNLPATVGEVLKERLAFLEDKERKLSEVEVKLQNALERQKDLESKLRFQHEVDEQKRKVDEKEAELARRELQLTHDTAKNIAAVAEAKASTCMEAMRLVFRNAEVRESVLNTTPVAVSMGGTNGQVYPDSVQQYQTSQTVSRSTD